jgi:bifunctional non-homologous end joining protein LigD
VADDLSFFAKHAPEKRPDWLCTREVASHSSRARTPGAPVRYLVIDGLPALIWAVNLAAIELHVPMWRFSDVGTGAVSGAGVSGGAGAPGRAGASEKAGASAGAGGAGAPGGPAPEPVPEEGNDPDLLVFDLDPGAPATVVECCRVAEALRPVLEADGLRPLPKTSGGKGLQLYAPVRGLTAEQARMRARDYAQRPRGPARSSSTGRRTTAPRPPSPPTRCAPATSPPSPPR